MKVQVKEDGLKLDGKHRFLVVLTMLTYWTKGKWCMGIHRNFVNR